ncbi:MAG: HD family phosphohydrolase [Ignavibacteriales bacterium]|nr:HD family phosphohydrolase [Ignavibacteriales bacterium]
MSKKSDIVRLAADYIVSLFQSELPAEYVYHSLDRTEATVKAARQLAKDASLKKGEREVVLLASWFHDAGYISTSEGHEEKSTELATAFLLNHQYPQEQINRVAGCIRATKVPNNPQDGCEEIVCDADNSYLFSKQFAPRNDLRRLEADSGTLPPIPDAEWFKGTIDFLKSRTLFTAPARKLYGKRRSKILIGLQEQLRKILNRQSQRTSGEGMKEELTALKLRKEKRPERGVETMFRITSQNHITLSSMADSKAHIMISINTVLISIVVTLLIRNLDLYPHLIIPTFLMLSVSLATMVFGILVTRPEITYGVFTKNDIRLRKANLLFFGNFHKMEPEDFQWGMNEMMNDREYLYGSMIKDFYQLGQVLGKKYKYLRVCYNIFMYGLILSVAAFTIAFLVGG